MLKSVSIFPQRLRGGRPTILDNLRNEYGYLDNRQDVRHPRYPPLRLESRHPTHPLLTPSLSLAFLETSWLDWICSIIDMICTILRLRARMISQRNIILIRIRRFYTSTTSLPIISRVLTKRALAVISVLSLRIHGVNMVVERCFEGGNR